MSLKVVYIAIETAISTWDAEVAAIHATTLKAGTAQMRRSVSYYIFGVFLIAAVVGAFVIHNASPAQAAAGDGGWVDHPGLVPDSPERDYPIILKTPLQGTLPRQTRVVDMIGPYIVSGGDFVNIELPNGGPIVNQPYLAIFDSRDKSLACTNLDVDDEVLSVAPGPEANTAIIGGRFDKVTGADGVQRTRNKIALIDLDTCEVDKSWIVTALNGKVTELAVTGNRLFLAGDFTSVAGTSIDHMAEVNLTTAALNTSFDPNFGGALSRAVVAMEASPDGSRLAIVHRATSISGVAMRGSAIFDISNPANITLTGHRMSTTVGNNNGDIGLNGIGRGIGVPYTRYFDIQAGAISPDFSTIVIVQGTATLSDFVTALPTTESVVQDNWQKFMRDSSFGAAATNDVVYVSGHFCKIDAGPGQTDLMAPNTGPSTCTGSNAVFNGTGVWRSQIAALDINTGRPMTWNPGHDAFVGGRAVTVVNRGLLMGFDGERSDLIRTGTTAFFDFGAPADPRDFQTCSAVVNGASVDVSWDAVPGVSSYVVRRNTKWVANAGNAFSYTDAPPSGTHTYFIRTTLDGVQRDVECDPTVTVAATAQTCTAVKNADDSITLTWDAVAGEDNYIVRRNGSYIATAGNVLTYTESPGDGVYTYVIRYKLNGFTTNTTCNPTITVAGGGGPGPDQDCTAVDNGDGTITLTWDAIPGEDNYIVRRNGVYLTTPGNVLTYTDSPGAAATYVIRSKMGGVTTNTTCVDGPAGPTPDCAVVDNGDGTVTLTWTAVAGEDNYIIRRNGNWAATAGNVLTFTVAGHTAGDAYIVRSNEAGVVTNWTCVF